MFKKVNLNLLSRYLNDASQVVVRTDFNVPIKEGKILDLARVKGTAFITQPRFPLCATSSAIIPNLSCCFPISAGPTELPLPSIRCG